MNPGDLVVATCDTFLWANMNPTGWPHSVLFQQSTPFLLLKKNGNSILLLSDGKQWIGDRQDFKRAECKE